MFAAAPAQGLAPTPTATYLPGPPLASGISKQRVTFQSDSLTLIGFLYRSSSEPSGAKLPAIIWNHGSEQNPGTGPEFDAIADIFVPAGYVVFAPMRRGHGDSQGEYIQTTIMNYRKTHTVAQTQQFFVQQMAGPQLDDQLAGLSYLKSQPDVDTGKLAVVGCSYGGIETLFGAEANAGYKAAVAESPGAESWQGDTYLQTRLLQAVDHITIPTFLLQPEGDVNTAPGYTLGQEFQKLDKPYGFEIYPPYGPTGEQGHCFGGAAGFHIWGTDVLTFLSNTLEPSS
ncbi:MAG TPA: CocE/NonD family hydrolase [Phototrophicaceae bacterium]|nr:CocE/NonD family hydrolase [Phototrophicaceae bacterium]